MTLQESEMNGLSHRLGRKLTALTVGMDQFERQQSGGEGALDSEGLVPIYLGESLVEPKPLSSWGEAEAELTELTQQAQTLPDGTRKVFLSSMIESLRVAASLFQGHTLSYGDKLERLVGVSNEPVSEALISELHAQ